MSINIRHHGHIHSLHLHQRTQEAGDGRTGRLGNRIVRMKAAVHRFFHPSKTAHAQKIADSIMKNLNISNEMSSSFIKAALDTSLDAIKKNSQNVKNITGNDLKNLRSLAEGHGGLRTFITGIQGLVRFSSDPEIAKSAQNILNTEIGGNPFREFGTYSPTQKGSAINWIKTASDKELNSAAKIINQIAEDVEKLTLRIDEKSVSSPSPSLHHTSDERVPEFGEKRMADDWTDKISKQDRKAIYQKGI
ncbi:TPA: hypothetical protein O3H02_004302 [Salmonella enterica subsp. enterica serovar Saintpaul str. CFSAN004144]|nr:hypothetical protein [Salmonella enterica subsp. enterica serovar Saintpaul str. CFSAN004144]